MVEQSVLSRRTENVANGPVDLAKEISRKNIESTIGFFKQHMIIYCKRKRNSRRKYSVCKKNLEQYRGSRTGSPAKDSQSKKWSSGKE